MPQNSTVVARFFAAIGLTLRFAFYSIQLHVALCLLVLFIFHLGTEHMFLVAAMYFGVFFTVAFLEHGRGSTAIRMVALLAGLGAAGIARVAGDSASDNDNEFPQMTQLNPSTGLPLVAGIGGVDVAGNAYGMAPFNSSSDDDWSSSANFGASSDLHHSVNPANGLPMVNDMFSSSSSMFDDSSSTNMFDDDWNK